MACFIFTRRLEHYQPQIPPLVSSESLRSSINGTTASPLADNVGSVPVGKGKVFKVQQNIRPKLSAGGTTEVGSGRSSGSR
jgi:hypothetical protein